MEENKNDIKSLEEFTDANNAEIVLRKIAKYIIILGEIMLLVAIIVGAKAGSFLMGLISGVAFLIYAVVIWAILNVFVNISTTLKKINEKIK